MNLIESINDEVSFVRKASEKLIELLEPGRHLLDGLTCQYTKDGEFLIFQDDGHFLPDEYDRGPSGRERLTAHFREYQGVQDGVKEYIDFKLDVETVKFINLLLEDESNGLEIIPSQIGGGHVMDADGNIKDDVVGGFGRLIFKYVPEAK